MRLRLLSSAVFPHICMKLHGMQLVLVSAHVLLIAVRAKALHELDVVSSRQGPVGLFQQQERAGKGHLPLLLHPVVAGVGLVPPEDGCVKRDAEGGGANSSTLGCGPGHRRCGDGAHTNRGD